MNPEIQIATNTLVFGTEVAFASLSERHDFFDIYIFTASINAESTWKIYANAGGLRVLVGQAKLGNGATGPTAIRIPIDTNNENLPNNEMGGVTFDLVGQLTNSLGAGASVQAGFVGYDYPPATVQTVNAVGAPTVLASNGVESVLATNLTTNQYHDVNISLPNNGRAVRFTLYGGITDGATTMYAPAERIIIPANTGPTLERIIKAVTFVGAGFYELRANVDTSDNLSGTATVTDAVVIGYNQNNGTGSGASQNLMQDTWHINAVTGNDSNDGLTSLSALKTVNELVNNRWNGGFLNPVSKLVTVFLDSDIPSTDPLETEKINVDEDVTLLFKGNVFTPIFVGALTAATALNRGANQNPTITDVLAPWGANINSRIRNTTVGPRLDSIAGIQIDLGAGVAQISQAWKTLLAGTIPVFLSAGSFVALDTYVIEALPKMTISSFGFGGKPGISSFQFPVIKTEDVDIEVDTFAFAGIDIDAECAVEFYACRLPNMGMQGGLNNFYNNIYKDSIIRCVGNAGFGIFGGSAVNPNGFFTVGPEFSVIFAFDFSCATINLQAGSLLNTYDDVGVFNSPTNGISNNAFIRNNVLQAVPFLGSGALYGANNTLVGIRLGSNVKLIYQPPGAVLTITGVGGNFEVGAAGALATPDPATNTNTAAIVQSWANLPAARPGGFAGTVINPANQAAILPAA